MIDQLERVRSLLKKVTYKPGWRFNADSSRADHQYANQHGWDRVVIAIIAPMQNLSGTGEIIEVADTGSMGYEQLARMTDGDIIGYWITQCIRTLEMHEMDEWFKFDGFHVRDPHPENKSNKKLDKQLTTV